jgi:hypothetical protein
VIIKLALPTLATLDVSIAAYTFSRPESLRLEHPYTALPSPPYARICAMRLSRRVLLWYSSAETYVQARSAMAMGVGCASARAGAGEKRRLKRLSVMLCRSYETVSELVHPLCGTCLC